jgi:cellulose synthase/poly-beta-1,6-N-acetylglucosamine synthase-like glycosyltransferase
VTRFQNFQFWTMSAMTQYGRIRTGTVSLGGNGQFTRLSALLEIGEQPWNASLTEDLDLTISMLVNGWRCTTTPHASVDQQGVERVRALLKQRTRWYQGHMMAGARIPEIWRSPTLRHTSAVEAILYLLVPWVLDLPWSILYHLAVVMFVLHSETNGVFAQDSAGHIVGWIALYVVAFYPAIVTSVLCFRRDPQVGLWHSILLGHSFVLMNYLSWACSWRALFRMLRGQNGWAKTDRNLETGPPASRDLVGTPA